MKIFIDGSHGTTGLQLKKRLLEIKGLEYIEITNYKDIEERKKALNKADVAFLCLPDDAAIQAVNLVENKNTIIIDSSTAHRTANGWTYGFPELGFDVKNSNRIAVPGCHATGFNAICYPLQNLLPKNIICYSLTGYSGGGNAMIEEFETPNTSPQGAIPYSLNLNHKHLKEMMMVCNLEKPPIFQPILTTVKQGMLVSIPLFEDKTKIYEILKKFYASYENIKIKLIENQDRLNMISLNNTNQITLYVYGNQQQTIVTAQLDNLGKGASGAAVQCFKMRCKL